MRTWPYGVGLISIFGMFLIVIFLVVPNSKSLAKQQKLIAVLGGTGATAYEQVYGRLAAALAESSYNEYISMRFCLFCPTDKIQVNAMCESVLVAKPDLIIAVGATAAQNLWSAMQSRKIRKPVICVGVPTMVELGLIESFDRPGGCMTGVVLAGQTPDLPLASIIRAVAPAVRNILVPYGATSVTVESVLYMIRQLRERLTPYGVAVHDLPLSDTNDVLQKVAEALQGCDMLVGLEYEALVSQYSPGYVKICEQAGIPYFCATLGSAGFEPAVTYAVDAAPMGEQALRLAERILFDGADPASTPVVSLASLRSLYFNRVRGGRQGHVPDLEEIGENLMKHAETVELAARMYTVSESDERCDHG